MRLSARRVRRLRSYIAANRCDVRPGLTHTWEPIYACIDSTTFAPPAEHVADRCTKCQEERWA